jgi:hypothetical protein
MHCKHCGKWSGFFQDYHEDCAAAVAQGKRVADLRPGIPANRIGVSVGMIAKGVFFGNLFFALLAALVSGFILFLHDLLR